MAHINAVVFVVCADVDHATQVAQLLRTPEYLGKELAVLQVDSKHEDETTQGLLENIDKPDSTVLAVVSVNKLKEGWDVKNIAVIVTLRAMASEVLTQQTIKITVWKVYRCLANRPARYYFSSIIPRVTDGRKCASAVWIGRCSLSVR